MPVSLPIPTPHSSRGDAIMEALKTARGSLARKEAPSFEVRKAHGSILVDTDGKQYIDFLMGFCVGNLGWSLPELERSAASFDGPDYVHPELGYVPWDELADLLVEMTPRKLTRCFRATGGSEAVALALQAAMIHTGRHGFLRREGSRHGHTLAGPNLAGRGAALPPARPTS